MSPSTITIQVGDGWRRVRPRKLTLQHLPREIQLLIFEHVLVDGPLLDKKHRIDCQYKTIPAYQFEVPPFFQNDLHYSHPLFSPNLPPCECAKRRGLALLRTCKTIHDTAYPIFWSKNTFCFSRVGTFVQGVGALRQKYRELIQHLIFVLPDNSELSYLPFPREGAPGFRFWNNLKKCKSLRSLHMPVDFLRTQGSNGGSGISHPEVFNEMATNLPNLSVINFGFMLPYSDIEFFDYPARYYRLTMARFSAPVWLRGDNQQSQADEEGYHRQRRPKEHWTTEMVKDLHRELQSNLRVHVDTAIRLRFYGAKIEDLRASMNSFRFSSDIHEDSDTREVQLPTGKTARVQFYGVPVSKNTRIKQAKAKRALDRQQLNTNGLTCAQEKAEKDMREKKRSERNTAAKLEMEQHGREVQDRVVRRLDSRKKENKDLKCLEKRDKRQVRRAIKVQGLVRQEERKRGSR